MATKRIHGLQATIQPVQTLSIRTLLSSFALLVATMLTLSINPLLIIHSKDYDKDGDIWWHIRVGDWIAQHHALPRVAIFSQYSDRPWTAYSWCFDLLVSGFHSIFGLTGIPSLLLCIVILIALALVLSFRHVAGNAWGAWAVATPLALVAHIDALRPMSLTVLFFIFELLLIFEAERTGDDRMLYRLAPLFAIWANCHIQFVYGIAVFGLYLGSRILSRIATEKDQNNRIAIFHPTNLKLAGFGGLAIAASCIGPNGWRPYKVAIGYAHQTFAYRVISEFQAMNFRSLDHYILVVVIMAACFAVGRPSWRDCFRPGLMLMTALVSFRSTRDMWFAAISAGFVIAEAIRLSAGQQTEESPRTTTIPRWDIAAYALATVLAATAMFRYGMHNGMTTAGMIREIDMTYPIRATEFIRNSHPSGPIFNSMNWGGFLIYNLPGEPVSIDPRTDVYGDQLLARSLATGNAMKIASDTSLARSRLVILERTLPLASALAANSNYHLVYQDNVAVVFTKEATAQ